MERKKSTVLNGLMIDILGVPSNWDKDPYLYPGHYALIGKWMKDNTPEYVHWVLTNISDYLDKQPKTVNVGYIITAIKSKKNQNRWLYVKDGYKIVDRDVLEYNGMDIPLELLSLDERQKYYSEYKDIDDSAINDLKNRLAD